jgi:hypothetical protein
MDKAISKDILLDRSQSRDFKRVEFSPSHLVSPTVAVAWSFQGRPSSCAAIHPEDIILKER